MSIRVLIVDDSVVCREALRCALAGLPDIEVLAAAPTAAVGMLKVRQARPDMVVLGSNVKDMSPADFASAALAILPQLGILVAAGNANGEADQVIEVLARGAFDFIIKPLDQCEGERVPILRRMLVPRIRAFSIKRYSRLARRISSGGGSRGSATEPGLDTPEERLANAELARSAIARKIGSRGLAAALIGVSTGGPEALVSLIPALPANLPVPVVIVMHMPRLFTGRMASALNAKSCLTVKEAEDGDELQPGTVYLAPGGLHLSVERGTRRRAILRTSDDPPVAGCKPSVDAFFLSAAEVFKGDALAVILTGMGDDGTRGLAALKSAGASVLAQDEASSVVWGMPGSAVRAGVVDEIVSLERIAGRIAALAAKKQ